jgi:catalase
VAVLSQDGHTAEFIKDQFRHCKTILALGASQLLLLQAGLPVSMDKSMAQGGTGLILAAAADAEAAAAEFIANIARHRHFGREMDPPLL